MSFQKELKKVREQLGRPQSELGKAIGVGFSSITDIRMESIFLPLSSLMRFRPIFVVVVLILLMM